MNTPLERPEYYRRIDEALLNRGRIVSAIEAFLTETNSNRTSSAYLDLLATLRGNPTTEQFIHDRSKTVWLPLLLRAGSGVRLADFQHILGDLSLAAEVRNSGRIRNLYPMAVGAIAMAMMLFISTTILPTFKSMFREFELKLPAATQLVLSIGSFINSQPVLCFVYVVVAFFVARLSAKAFFLMLRHLEGSSLIGPLLAGNSESVRAMGRFTSTLAELLHVGAPLPDAIEIAGHASQNVRTMKMSSLLSREVNSTGAFSQGSIVSQNFPDLVYQALEAGPNKTPSIPLLRQLAVIYFDRVETRFNWSSGLLSPLAIIVIGFGVGFVVISLLLPLLSLITSLSGPGQ